MTPIHKHLVTDEHGAPVAVQVRYEDWLKIEQMLAEQEPPPAPAGDIMRHAGTLTLEKDPLAWQREVRGEWP